MKKFISILLVLLLAFSSVAFAEEAETGSQFENVLLKKGSAIIKYFESAGSIETDWYKINLQAATLTDLETGSKYYALRMEHHWYASQYSSGDSVGVIDSDEIDGAISTLEYIKAHKSEMKNYTEIAYTTSSGLQIGAYKNSSESSLFVRFSSQDTAFIALDNIDTVISSLRSAQAKLGK